MTNSEQDAKKADFQAVKARLEEIAKTVEDDTLSLDEALDLYEEAVKLGLEASNLLEVGIADDEDDQSGAPEVVDGITDVEPLSGESGEGVTEAFTA
mgnify:CR=1 FL=1